MIGGIVGILVSSIIVTYLLRLEIIKQTYNLSIPYEFIVVSGIFLIAFFVYYFIQSQKFKSIIKELEKLNLELNNFITSQKFSIETQNSYLANTFVLLNKIFNDFIQTLSEDIQKAAFLENEKNQLEEILDLESVYILEITISGKVVRANKPFLKFLNFKNETQLNMKIKHIYDIFEEEIEDEISNLIGKEIKVTIKNKKFSLYIEKVSKDMLYVMTLIDITHFEEEKNNIIKQVEYASKNLKNLFSINKSKEILMIRILNYDNYASYLGSAVMDIFIENFVEKIKTMGYEDIFKVQNNTFAVYDFNVNFEQYKTILEENIIITVGKDRYIFNPKVILASGVNFEQAYQQILESGKTLISKQKVSSKYNLEIIKIINKVIYSDSIKLGYKYIINNKDTIIIYPVIVDEYGNVLPQDEVEGIAREFNLYLYMLKQVIINHINIIKNYKIIVNVSSEDLFAMTMLKDLASFIKREELMIVFNVSINSKYSLIYPILKYIKSFAQIGIRNVGHGYISFKDIYTLKVGYLELDDGIMQLAKEDKKWEFLINSIKLLVSEQNTKLLSNIYNDDKIYQISKDIKIL